MTKKIAISLPDDVADHLAGQPNVSAYVAAAVRARMNPSRLEEMLRAVGYEITEAGKSAWRDRLAQPLGRAALERSRMFREKYGIPQG